MSGRIREVQISTLDLTPALAEIWIAAKVDVATQAAELRGRLMGPHCLYSSTVEIAYPIRTAAPTQDPTDFLQAHVTIPEPNLWDVQSPFLYSGPVELWQNGQRFDTATVRWGLREASGGPKGLTWNGRPFRLHGLRTGSVTENQLRALRQAGTNTLLVPVAEEAEPLWEAADRIGMMVLGEMAAEADSVLDAVMRLRTHPSHLGWLVRPGGLLPKRLNELVSLLYAGCVNDRQVLGLALEEAPREWLDNRARFVVCPPSLLPHLHRVNVPRVVWGMGEPADAPPEVIGFIAEAV